MLIKIIPVVVLAGALALTGCSAVDTHLESERLSAQARADEAQAQIIAAQAMSATLAAQTAQVERLAGEVVRQSETTRLIALALAGVLAVLIVGGVVIAVLALRRPTVTYYQLPARPATPPMLDDPDEWPEVQARRRALIAARQEREP